MRHGQRSAAHRVAALLITLVLAVSACSSGRTEQPPATPSTTHPADQDPAPTLPATGQAVQSAGATVEQGDVSVQVPPGAVAPGESIEVKVGPELGRLAGPAAVELAGRPVSVEHKQSLAAPLTLSWTLPQLTEQQRASLVLVRWDAATSVWTPTPEPLRWEGDTLHAEVQKFSVLDWVANVGQAVGTVTGSRADAPTCNGARLPSWVKQTVDPDEDTSAAAIRVCFEADADQRVTVRVVNNRTFAQVMTMTDSGHKWAWTWTGDGHSVADLVVYRWAHDKLDSGTTFVLPPLSSQAVGIARPAEPGSQVIAAEAKVTWSSAMVDVMNYAFSQIDFSSEYPVLDVFVQVMYECGGQAASEYHGPKDVLPAVVNTLGDCATEITRNDSEFGTKFEELSRRAIERGGKPASFAIQANRLAHEAAGAFRIIEAGKLAFYGSDQFANGLVKPLSWSIRGNGQQPELGAWRADCSSYSADATNLYRNIALRDEFSDTHKELWQFAGLPAAARAAVKPLLRCSSSYRTGVANYLPSSWADAKAARIVAAQIVGNDTPATAGVGRFAGTWYRHGQQIRIKTDGTGLETYRTYSEPPGERMYYGYDTMEFAISPDGRSLYATVVSTRYDDGDGHRVRKPDEGASRPGDTSTFRFKSTGALNEHPGRTTAMDEDDLAWCRDGVQDGQCGA